MVLNLKYSCYVVDTGSEKLCQLNDKKEMEKIQVWKSL